MFNPAPQLFQHKLPAASQALVNAVHKNVDEIWLKKDTEAQEAAWIAIFYSPFHPRVEWAGRLPLGQALTRARSLVLSTMNFKM